MSNDDTTPAADPAALPPTAEILGDSVTTTHRITARGGELAYTATAGRLTIGEEQFDDGVFRGNKAKAQVFVTSYVLDLDDEARERRPVTFIFNGGPGSPTVWLQFGLFGPHRVCSGDVDDPRRAPFVLEENAETLLVDSDLVFIDPMTTGFSRATEGTDPSAYHGFSGDRDLVAETIRLWITHHRRWNSPKLLAGESYGTTRAAAVARQLLDRHSLGMDGIILISPVLDFGTVFFSEGNDDPYVYYLPTYAATAHYHGRLPGRDLRELLDEVQHFAETDYRIALGRGNRMPADERAAVAQKVAEYTGLSAEYVLRCNLRIEHLHFSAELLRDRGLTVGRLDTRFTGHPGDLTRDVIDVDPSYDAIRQPYAVAANHYIRRTLGYETELSYELLSGRVQPWSYKEFENASVTTAEDLARVMRADPALKVYVGYGFYDAATPYAAAEAVCARLRIPASALENLFGCYYPAGHMTYVHEPSRVAQSGHLSDFIAWVCGGERPDAGEYAFHPFGPPDLAG